MVKSNSISWWSAKLGIFFGKRHQFVLIEGIWYLIQGECVTVGLVHTFLELKVKANFLKVFYSPVFVVSTRFMATPLLIPANFVDSCKRDVKVTSIKRCFLQHQLGNSMPPQLCHHNSKIVGSKIGSRSSIRLVV